MIMLVWHQVQQIDVNPEPLLGLAHMLYAYHLSALFFLLLYRMAETFRI